MKLTIYFDGNFWCGLIEYEGRKGDYRAVKHFFGPEPKDSEIENFIHFSLTKVIEKNDRNIGNNNVLSVVSVIKEKKLNPKKMQRKISKEKQQPILSTKAQLAIQETRENSKLTRKKEAKEEREFLKKRKFELKQRKKMEKKKGH